MKHFWFGTLLAFLAGALVAPWLAERAPSLFAPFAREVRAGTAQRLDTVGLVQAASLIVEGEVVAANASQASDGVIDTEYTLRVDRTFLGDDLAVRSFRLPGGVLEDGRGLILPGLPHPAIGERAILFLTGEGPQGRRMPVGLGQGRWRVVPEPKGGLAVLTDLAGLTLVDQGIETHVPASSSARSYAEAVAELHAALATRQGGNDE